MLISCKLREGQPWFGVHKQGLLILRNYRNKRVSICQLQLRIIFNIEQEQDDLERFNATFLNTQFKQENHNRKCQNTLTELRISQYSKQLSDNRVLIFLNAYMSKGFVHLTIIGYLVASVFFYHNHGQLTQSSNLTAMLSEMKKLLCDTEVHKLQKIINIDNNK